MGPAVVLHSVVPQSVVGDHLLVEPESVGVVVLRYAAAPVVVAPSFAVDRRVVARHSLAVDQVFVVRQYIVGEAGVVRPMLAVTHLLSVLQG